MTNTASSSSSYPMAIPSADDVIAEYYKATTGQDIHKKKSTKFKSNRAKRQACAQPNSFNAKDDPHVGHQLHARRLQS